MHKSYGTPAKLLDNLSNAESSNDPYAINPKSKALGRYQFIPETVAMLHKQGIKFNPFDADESRSAADYYIQQLVKQNGGDYTKAMMQYGGFKKADPTKYLSQVMNGVDLGNATATPATATPATATPATATPATATATTATPATPATATPATATPATATPAVSVSKMSAFNPSDVDAAVKQLVPPKPGSPPAQWEKYYAAQTAVRNSYIDAPLAIAKNAANTTAVRDAANSAARENQMKQLTHEADTYVPILDQMQSIAADPKNEKIFAIGNKSNDTFSKFASAAEHLGESPEQIKRDYLVWNRSIDNNDRAKMENYNSNSQKVIAAYVHNTFPGRILASELQLGNQAKGVSIDNQRTSNLASLALMRGEYDLAKREAPALEAYRAKYGADRTFDEFEHSTAPEGGRRIIEQVKQETKQNYPSLFKFTR